MSPVCLYQKLGRIMLCRRFPAGTAGQDCSSCCFPFLTCFVPAQALMDPGHNLLDHVEAHQKFRDRGITKQHII